MSVLRATVLILAFGTLVAVPWLFGGRAAMALAVQVALLSVVALSAGIVWTRLGAVSLAQPIFFAMGSLGALSGARIAPDLTGLPALLTGGGFGVLAAAGLALLLGGATLRAGPMVLGLAAAVLAILAGLPGGPGDAAFALAGPAPALPPWLSGTAALRPGTLGGLPITGDLVRFLGLMAACLGLLLAAAGAARPGRPPDGAEAPGSLPRDLAVFCLAAAFAAAAGVLAALWLGSAPPRGVLGVEAGLAVLAAAVLGGPGRRAGALPGAAAVVLLVAFGPELAAPLGAGLQGRWLDPSKVDVWKLWLALGVALALLLRMRRAPGR